MAGYELSYTAQEVDELLGKVAVGAVLPFFDLTGLLQGNEIVDQTMISQLDNAYQASPGVLVNFDLYGEISTCFLGRMKGSDGSEGFIGYSVMGMTVLGRVPKDDGSAVWTFMGGEV